MLNFIKKILDLGPGINYAELKERGVIILDVRTRGEFSSGHVQGSINIPVGELSSKLDKIKNKEKPIITCCASGMRSASAKSILVSKGYKEVYNGGSWMNVKTNLKQSK